MDFFPLQLSWGGGRLDQFRDAGHSVHITQGMYNNMIYILPQKCFQRMLVGLQLCISFLVQLQSGSIPVRIFCLVEKWIGIVHCTVYSMLT
jgi:hypothetical protein